MSLKSFFTKLFVLPSLYFLTSCGNISPITKVDGTVAQKNDFAKYHNSNVTIGQFVSHVDKNPKAKEIDISGADSMCKTLPDKIAKEMQKQGITVNTSSDGIIIEGIVVGYKEGDNMLKRLIGFEAGRTHLDIDINILDVKTRDVLGVIQSRQASYLLGGPIAVSDTPDSLSNALAVKVAKQLKKMQ